jgi:hypothetical protein
MKYKRYEVLVKKQIPAYCKQHREALEKIPTPQRA